jgi:hypothetical protein
MYTFTFGVGRSWVARLIGRHPLVRGSDRIEALTISLADDGGRTNRSSSPRPTMLSARFPDRDDIGRLVTQVYGELAVDARIPTHLIPLTLNRCRRLLSEFSVACSTTRAGC